MPPFTNTDFSHFKHERKPRKDHLHLQHLEDDLIQSDLQKLFLVSIQNRTASSVTCSDERHE